MQDISAAMAGGDLKSYAYNLLKKRLINCSYAPGSILNEAQLSTELKLSRTPVREAISRLEMEGFVKILPKKGIYVTDILLGDVLQIYEIRIEMEPVTLRMAAPRLPKEDLEQFCRRFKEDEPDIRNRFNLDTAMHLFIIENCGNRYMVDIMHRVFDVSTRIIYFVNQNHAQIHDAPDENLEILHLLMNQEVDQAVVKMRIHMEHCRKAALDYFYTMPSGSDVCSHSYRDELYKR